jgi:hypothetical protein
VFLSTPAIISVFSGRVADTGVDPLGHMVNCRHLLNDAKLPKAELLWASPREVFNVMQAELAGCDSGQMQGALAQKANGSGFRPRLVGSSECHCDRPACQFSWLPRKQRPRAGAPKLLFTHRPIAVPVVHVADRGCRTGGTVSTLPSFFVIARSFQLITPQGSFARTFWPSALSRSESHTFDLHCLTSSPFLLRGFYKLVSRRGLFCHFRGPDR